MSSNVPRFIPRDLSIVSEIEPIDAKLIKEVTGFELSAVAEHFVNMQTRSCSDLANCALSAICEFQEPNEASDLGEPPNDGVICADEIHTVTISCNPETCADPSQVTAAGAAISTFFADVFDFETLVTTLETQMIDSAEVEAKAILDEACAKAQAIIGPAEKRAEAVIREKRHEFGLLRDELGETFAEIYRIEEWSETEVS